MSYERAGALQLVCYLFHRSVLMPVAASVSWCVLMASTRASKISFAVDVLVCWLGCVSDDVIGFADESYS